jgi:hypothetical protein
MTIELPGDGSRAGNELPVTAPEFQVMPLAQYIRLALAENGQITTPFHCDGKRLSTDEPEIERLAPAAGSPEVIAHVVASRQHKERRVDSALSTAIGQRMKSALTDPWGSEVSVPHESRIFGHPSDALIDAVAAVLESPWDIEAVDHAVTVLTAHRDAASTVDATRKEIKALLDRLFELSESRDLVGDAMPAMDALLEAVGKHGIVLPAVDHDCGQVVAHVTSSISALEAAFGDVADAEDSVRQTAAEEAAGTAEPDALEAAVERRKACRSALSDTRTGFGEALRRLSEVLRLPSNAGADGEVASEAVAAAEGGDAPVPELEPQPGTEMPANFNDGAEPTIGEASGVPPSEAQELVQVGHSVDDDAQKAVTEDPDPDCPDANIPVGAVESGLDPATHTAHSQRSTLPEQAKNEVATDNTEDRSETMGRSGSDAGFLTDDEAANEAENRMEPNLDAAPEADALWRMVAGGHTALAYHLARSMETRLKAPLDGCGSACLLALSLSRELGAVTDLVIEPLREALAQCVAMDPDSRADALLLFAAALRPAVLAPYLTSGRVILEHLLHGRRVDNQALRDLAEAVIETGRLGAGLSEATFKGERAQTSQARALSEARQAAEQFLRQVQLKTIKYAAATSVWRAWANSGEPARMLRAVIDDDRNLIADARKFVAVWSDRRKLGPIIDETDQELRKRLASRRPIEGAAREDLVTLALEATRHVQEWLRLVDAAAHQGAEDETQALSGWVSRTLTLADKALEALRTQTPFGIHEQAGLSAARAAIDDLRALIDAEIPCPPRLHWREVLGRPLALLPHIQLDAQWSPLHAYGEPWFEETLTSVLETPPSLTGAWAFSMKQCLHQSSERLLVLQRFDGADPSRLEERDRERGERLQDCRARLREGQLGTERAIAHALDFGWIDETTRATLTERLVSIDATYGDDIGRAFPALDAIASELEEHKRSRVVEERERLSTHPVLSRNDALRERIDALLEAGDIVTAAEYVWHAECGTEPPSDDRVPHLQDDFFPHFVELAESICGALPPGDVRAKCADGEWPSGLHPAPECPDTALELLDAFARACRYAEQGHRDDLDAVADYFKLLGVDEVRVKRAPGGSASARPVRLDTRRLHDRDTCIIPEYGSLAHGHYQVICIPHTVAAIQLFRVIADAAGLTPGIPTLVLYDGRIGVHERRELARQSRARGSRFLLIDEWLTLYLSALQRPVRLKALFECALPFVVANPYASTAEVPEEMFFGRRQAIRSIVDPYGTNLVFGGRQLGKTALLREVVRRYHNPQIGFVVLWIDLEFHEVGKARALADIWAVIAGQLPVEISGEQHLQRYDTLERRILTWLEGDTQRRLLLLLDETDTLLSQDADDEYRILRGLKGLMERSQRRCKVVLAGLHNVQRASRDPNTPVAHLAQPVCIGPLIEDGEAREAFRLVTMPLRAMGYRIEDDVVNRILGYAAYAPNLIQDFVKRLLEDLNRFDQSPFDPEVSPPFVITSEHVEKAYQLKDLRGFVRDRFSITLDLDTRYKLIALIIAHETLRRRQSETPEVGSAFDVGWIRKEALSWWERGFPDASAEAFRVLLDEMVGLGILRVTEGAYALRSPNLVNLLGSHGTIEQDLQDAASTNPPAPYTAAVHRRLLTTKRASPLTAEQEHLLTAPVTGVSLVLGMGLSGIDEVVPALAEAAKSLGVKLIRVEPDALDAFLAPRGSRSMAAALDQQDQESHLLLLIGPQCAWTPEHVSQVAAALQSRRRRNRSARVAFVGGPSQARAWREAGLKISRFAPEEISLKPWALTMLQRYMRDRSMLLDDARAEAVRKVTGFWHGPLHEVFSDLAPDPDTWRERIDALASRSADNDSLRAELYIDEVVTDLFNEMIYWGGDPVTSTDLAELTALEVDLVEGFLNWGDGVGCLRAHKEGSWTIDPYVRICLE